MSDSSRMANTSNSSVDCGAVEDVTLSPVGPDLGTLYHQSDAVIDAWRARLVAESFRFHYEANSAFRRACTEANVSPACIHDLREASRIPLTPTRAFKGQAREIPLTSPMEQIEVELTSTGSSGVPSVARRDSTTTTRAALAIMAMYREFFRVADGVGLFVSPSPLEYPQMGLARCLHLLSGLLAGSFYTLHGTTVDLDTSIETLERYRGQHTRHVIGPPFLLLRFAHELRRRKRVIPLDQASLIITMGGWKRYTGQSIPRADFCATLAEAFELPCQRVRDIYALTECNMVAIECEHQRKHVAPWCHISVRSVHDLSASVTDGEIGVIAVLDPLNRSYPGFVLTDDLGSVEQGASCPCARNGQVLRYHGRVNPFDFGCCAVRLERRMASAATPKRASGID